jgi:ribosomal protein L11 methyltransferase
MKILMMRKLKRKNKISDLYHTLTLKIAAGLDTDQTGLFSAVFEDCALSFSCKKDKDSWEFLWTFDHRPEDTELARRFEIISDLGNVALSAFGTPVIEVLDMDRDWLAESYRALPPFNVGPYFIYGGHYEGTAPEGQIPLQIEAATAFGSGEHGTTSCCMLAIEHVKNAGVTPKNILDMGCGSGILAIAAAKLWPDVPVYAADNDPECVRVTDIHKTINDSAHIETFQSEGYESQSIVWRYAPYDFIIANILAGPLIDMAEEQSKALASGGYLILSGTLKEQAEAVLGAYTPHGLSLVSEFPGDEWMTLLLQKR